VALSLVVLTITGIALLARVVWDYQSVFGFGSVRFQSTDPWVHVRQIEYLVHHFPHRLPFDPFGAFPQGQGVAVAPFLDYFVAIVAKLATPLMPHAESVRFVCAWVPPMLAAVTMIAVYRVARFIFNPAVGLLAALLIAVTPGVYYTSSVLGFIDHHVMEVLLSTLALGLLLRAFGHATHVTLDTPGRVPFRGLARHAERSLLFGLALTSYLLTWIGGSFLLLIVCAWTACQTVSEHMKGKRSLSITIAIIPGTLFALVTVYLLREIGRAHV